MRPPIRARCWLCIVSSLALVASVLTSPIRTPQTPNARAYVNFLCRNFALVSDAPELAFSSAAPGRASIDADDFEDEDEDEPTFLVVQLVYPTDIPSVSPPQLLSTPRPGSSPPRTAAVPRRC